MLAGRISEITWSIGSVAKTQSRHANAASVAIPCRARVGVIDQPELHLVHVVDVLQDRPDVPEELPRLAVLDRQQGEPVALGALVHPLDPLARLLHAERVRVEPHVVRIGLDALSASASADLQRAEPQALGLDRGGAGVTAPADDSIS